MSLVAAEHENDEANVERSIGRYRLLRPIASGGMASVHLASADSPEGFSKLLAVKLIHEHLARDPSFVEMFLDEARIAARIEHANVCTVFDFGQCDGTYFIAMEYLVGETFGHVRDAVRKGPYPSDWPVMAASLTAQACEGLHAAHELVGPDGRHIGLVHRDVSPHNLFVTYGGVVKVVDFGIARAEGRSHHTTPGTLKGKFAYMAPEQLGGSETIDRRVDVWALGVTLWELLTLRPLFRKNGAAETLTAVLSRPIPPPSELAPSVPPELDAIVLRALARHPDARYSTARELGRDLMAFCRAHGGVRGPLDIEEWLGARFPENRAAKLSLTALAREQTLMRTRSTASLSLALGSTARSLDGSTPANGLTPPSGLTPPGGLVPSGGLPPVDHSGMVARRGAAGAAAVSEDEPAAKRRRTAGVALLVSAIALGAGAAAWQARDRVIGAAPAAVRSRMTLHEDAEARPPVRGRGGASDTSSEARETQLTSGLGSPESTASRTRSALPQGAVVGMRSRDRLHEDRRGSEPERPIVAEVSPPTPASDTTSTVAAHPAPTEAAPTPPPPAAPVVSVSATVAAVAPAPEPRRELPAPSPMPAATPTPVPAPSAPTFDAQVSIRGLTVRGALPATSVRASLDRATGQLRACYQQSARAAGRDAPADVGVRFAIDEDGSFRNVGASGPGSLGPCVQNAIARLRSRDRPDMGFIQVSFTVHYAPLRSER